MCCAPTPPRRPQCNVVASSPSPSPAGVAPSPPPAKAASPPPPPPVVTPSPPAAKPSPPPPAATPTPSPPTSCPTPNQLCAANPGANILPGAYAAVGNGDVTATQGPRVAPVLPALMSIQRRAWGAAGCQVASATPHHSPPLPPLHLQSTSVCTQTRARATRLCSATAPWAHARCAPSACCTAPAPRRATGLPMWSAPPPAAPPAPAPAPAPPPPRQRPRPLPRQRRPLPRHPRPLPQRRPMPCCPAGP
jgi:hypothetical protein